MTAQAVAADPAAGGKPFRLPATSSMAWPLAAIGLLLMFQLSMVFTRSVNWDEFWFYSHVADFSRGTLAQPLQSLHVRLFAWLPGLPGSGVDKIVIARLAMLACEAVTLAAIYALARRFAERPAAALAVLLYLSAGYVLQHGFSFRTDPMATAALMSALAILVRCRLGLTPLALFALLIALAGMITMKAVLFAPAFIGIAWMRWSEHGFSLATALRLAAAAVATVALFALIYTWHSAALTQDTEGTAMAVSASRWMFFLGVPPYWEMALKAVLTAPLMFLMALGAPLAIWRSNLSIHAKWALAGLWLPLTLPLYYTNTAAYFYAFMLAPVAVSAAVSAEAVLQRYPLAMVTGVLVLMAGGAFVMEDRSTIERQRALVETAETLLPPGTAYFDHNGMLSAYVKANNLMTPAGIDNYQLRGQPTYLQDMKRRPVPLLVANDPLFKAVMEGDENFFLPADAQALRRAYVHAWGPLWLAGFKLREGDPAVRDVLVPGAYRVEGASVTINGEAYEAGAVVELGRGTHSVATEGADARLIWNTTAPLPTTPWDDGPLYVGF